MNEITGNVVNESILVCVNYGSNGKRLIERGCKIANMLGCPIYILTIDAKPFDKLNIERSNEVAQWKQLANNHGVHEFIMKENESLPISKVIAEIAREKAITQIVLGQTARNRFQEITKGSLVNALLKELPYIDVHVVSVSQSLKHHEGHFERGVRAYLIEEKRQYRLSFRYTSDVKYEGIFYKELGTDFDNGIFKFIKDKEILLVNVTEDYVKELKNIEIDEKLDQYNIL